MEKRIGIISDDLTGANDSGVQLAKKHLTSTVVFDYETSTLATKPDVLIVDTDSRAKKQEEAYKAAYQAALYLQKEGYQHLYKKVDSTLRGNIAAELSAVEQVYQPEVVVVAPAFPKMNRQIIDGNHYVNGVLITDTEFSKDPKTPVTEAFIPELFKHYQDREIALINKRMLGQSVEEINQLITTILNQGVTWFVCDSETEEDLQRICSVFSSLNKKTVWAGSAGLIEYLPDALQLTHENEVNQEEIKIEKTLVVSGSLSQVTREQLCKIESLKNSFFMEVDPATLVKNTFKLDHYIDQLNQQSEYEHYVLYVEASNENRDSAKKAGEELGLTLTEVSENISRGLGQIAKGLLDNCASIHGLVLTGGDTAKAVCSELAISEMELYSEVEPGLPFGRLRSEDRSYWAVTKAGGFGHEQSLVNVVKYMANKRRVRA
ncbi:four-carbon acid sugar kinase family protein [Metabacillus halosaccharovorans]|uniref:four-carbon acid sugar kinase family protein n=1 Tax=Metabacillus halosaccharovorans TaxID=930124 RepID=UPI00203C8B26|nr:four-carbon acid sugar kinase family protein [Metabacillus halosaccharovorans]MCM3443517.1 four-carbon acid sugar kinase family protein [Metabacillus halosaccharovorans]